MEKIKIWSMVCVVEYDFVGLSTIEYDGEIIGGVLLYVCYIERKRKVLSSGFSNIYDMYGNLAHHRLYGIYI